MKNILKSLICIVQIAPFFIFNAAFSQNNTITATAFQNLAIDSSGRVIDITFNQNVALTIPWDRFRFTINNVQPLSRDGGAFLGDLNSDSVPDLIIAGFNGNIHFYPGIKGKYNQFGNGSLLKFLYDNPEDDPYSGPWGGYWIQGDIADLDGDGENEAILGGKLFKNTGTPSEPILKLGYTFNSHIDPAASIGDLNGDGKPDVVISFSYNIGTYIYWNNSSPGTFNFTQELLTTWPNYSANNNHVSLADLNGDGLLDLAGPAGIYFNTGTSQVPHFDFTNPSPWNKSGGPSWGAGSDQPPHIYLKDVNNDGLIDAYVSNLSNPLWQVLYYRNIGTSSSHRFEYVGPVVVKNTPLNLYYRGEDGASFSGKRGFVATADIDNNGYEDILLSTDGGESFGSPTILWNFSDSEELTQQTLTYQDLYTYASLDKVTSIDNFSRSEYDFLFYPANLFAAWSDFTKDGLPDIIQCDQFMDGFYLSLITRNGYWPFEEGNRTSITSQPSGVQATAMGTVVIDIDRDGHKDIVGGSEDGRLLFYRNLATDGTLSLADPVFLCDSANNPIVTGTQSWPAAIDLDGDGDLDFLVATENGVIYRVLCGSPGNSNGYKIDGLLGSLEQNPVNVTHTVGGGTITPSITTIDIDKDGLQDIVMADVQGYVWLLHNIGTVTEARFSLKPLIISKTNSTDIERIDNRHFRLYFSLPTIVNETKIYYYDIRVNNALISGEVVITQGESGIEEGQTEQLSVYPNPVVDKVFIKAAWIISEVSVWDVFGKCLIRKPVNMKSSSIDLSSLVPGIYILNIQKDKKQINRKIVIR
ncbi:MAG: T9SS type A sorting domain-containing protein [Bacteroidetes bacterium]|nr:T9SS type A sorting domain-containing protein [Bacteroidota bacterium]